MKDLQVWLNDALEMLEAMPTVKASTCRFSPSKIADELEEMGDVKVRFDICCQGFGDNFLYWGSGLVMMWNGWTGEVKLYWKDGNNLWRTQEEC